MIKHLTRNKKRYYIITGIPRSGTSLLCNLMYEQPNVICINEVLYNVKKLYKNLSIIRKNAIKKRPVPNIFKKDRLITDTLNGQNQIEYKIVDKKIDKNVIVGSKVNIPYLNRIDKILNLGLPIFALIRDPVYTIASWNSHKAQHIPEALVDDSIQHQRWKNFQFTSENQIIRQAEIWEYYARLLYQYKHKIMIIRYEDLTKNVNMTNHILNQITESLITPLNKISLPLENKNISTRFNNLKQIHDIVNIYCPTKDSFKFNQDI